MKYVRTKDGIIDMNKYDIVYKAESVYESELYVLKSKKHRKNGQDYTRILKEAVIKVADTIEELCDAFLVEYTNGEHMMFHDFYHLQRHHDLYSQDYHHVSGRYGCIWVTGKGLIYVAKMNKEGKLKLI